jgi:hypothetical protein
MPKYVLNAGIRHIRGAIDEWVYKHYKDKRGYVLTRRPDMSRVKPSAGQKAQRKRMREAAAYYREVKKDPKLLATFQRQAKRRGITVPAAVASDYFKQQRLEDAK